MGMTEDLVSWTHEQKCRRAVESLKRNGFTARFCTAPLEAITRMENRAATIIDHKPRLADLHVLKNT